MSQFSGPGVLGELQVAGGLSQSHGLCVYRAGAEERCAGPHGAFKDFVLYSESGVIRGHLRILI